DRARDRRGARGRRRAPDDLRAHRRRDVALPRRPDPRAARALARGPAAARGDVALVGGHGDGRGSARPRVDRAGVAARAGGAAPVEVPGTAVEGARAAVARARRYSARASRGRPLPPGFAVEAEGEIVVRELEDVRVAFEEHNLALDSAPRRATFDLVVSRNV